MLSLVGIEGNH